MLCIGLVACGRHTYCHVDTDCGAGQSCDPSGACTMRPSTCNDGVRDGDETDVDCGGSCVGCLLDKACGADADCLFGSCRAGLCERVSGPPFWIDEAPLPAPRADLAAAGTDSGGIYVVGGRDANGPVASVEIYDPVTRAWSAGPPLSSARMSLGMALGPDGAFYAVGGSDGQAPVATVERLDPQGGGWTQVAPLPTALSALAVGHSNGAIYALGGLDAGGQPVDTVEEFDLMTWSAAPALTTARSALAVSPPGGNGFLHVMGGRSTNGPTALVEDYDPEPTGTTVTMGMPLPDAREGLAGSPDGLLTAYAIGGLLDGADSGEVDRLGPFDDGWVVIAPLHHPRHGLAACLGSDGRVYAIGGADASGPVDFVESYGPRVTITPDPAAVGQTVALSGDNFAPDARVDTSFGKAITDATGHLAPITHVVDDNDLQQAPGGVEAVAVTDFAAVVSFSVYLRVTR